MTSGLHQISRRLFVYIICGITGLLGGMAIWWSSPHGLYQTPDSRVYLAAADSLISSGSLAYWDGSKTNRLTHFPPLYPFAVSTVATLTNSSTVNAARIWNGVCGFILVLLCAGLLDYSLQQRAAIAILPAVILTLGGSATLQILALSAWSELQFICFWLGGTLVLLGYCSRQQDFWRLVLASLLFACAGLTRYAGLILVPFLVLVVFLVSGPTAGQKWGRSLLAGVVASLPILGWLWHNSQAAGNMTNRRFGFQWPAKREWFQMLNTIGDWLLPSLIPRKLAYVIVVIFVGIGAWALVYWWRRPNTETPLQMRAAVALLAGFGLCYFGFVVFARLFFDHAIPLDFRLLSPIYVSLVLIVGLVLGSRALTRWRMILLVVAVLYLVAINIQPRFNLDQSGYQFGLSLRHQAPSSAP